MPCLAPAPTCAAGSRLRFPASWRKRRPKNGPPSTRLMPTPPSSAGKNSLRHRPPLVRGAGGCSRQSWKWTVAEQFSAGGRARYARPDCLAPSKTGSISQLIVGVAGFEPTTSSSRTKRATKLRHTPLEATTAYRTRPSTGQTAGLPGQIPAASSLELDQRLGRTGGIEPLGADPLVAEVGVGVAVAAVGEQRDHRTAAACRRPSRRAGRRPPQVGARRRPHPASQHGADVAGRGDRRRVGHRDHPVDHVGQKRRLHPRPADALDARRRPA